MNTATALDSSEVIEVAGQKCMMSILRDTTEQKLLEKQLRQAQKMEAIGQLSGGIAHDFNNLLSVIIGYSEMVEENLPTQDDPQRKLCEQTQKAAHSAASLTNQLLAFSRQQELLEPKVLDLNDIILNVEKMLRRLIGEHIDLQAVLDPTLGNIKADQGQIEQVIINLVVNARDAMPQGGKVMIETMKTLIWMRIMHVNIRLNYQGHTCTWQFPTPELAWMPKPKLTYLSRSSLQRRSARAQGWVFPPSMEL